MVKLLKMAVVVPLRGLHGISGWAIQAVFCMYCYPCNNVRKIVFFRDCCAVFHDQGVLKDHESVLFKR